MDEGCDRIVLNPDFNNSFSSGSESVSETVPLKKSDKEFDLSHRFRKSNLAHRRARSFNDKQIYDWRDVKNIDLMLTKVEHFNQIYEYYEGKGIACILARDISSLVYFIIIKILVFIVFLLVFLVECVDYSLIVTSKKLSKIVIPQCMAR